MCSKELAIFRVVFNFFLLPESMSKMQEDYLVEPDTSVIADLSKNVELFKKMQNGLTIMVMPVEQTPKV